MPYKVTADICVEVDDTQADNEDQAKLIAVEQLSDFFRHNTWEDLLSVRKFGMISPYDPSKCHFGYCVKKKIHYEDVDLEGLRNVQKGICPICKALNLLRE